MNKNNTVYFLWTTKALLFLVLICMVGIVKAQTIYLSNTCPNTTVDLTSHYTGTPPTGTTLVWFNNNAHSGTRITSPTTVGAGTYYAFYYDSINNCYSPPSNAIVVSISPCPVDVQINKVGPLGAQTGSIISYNIHVSNNGSGNASNIVVKDPAVANFTVTDVTCNAGGGTLSYATCPSSVTIAGLQGSGLTIPSLPAGSSVSFKVTGVTGITEASVISNTATIQYAGDTDASNNSSSVSTTLYNCTSDESTYVIDVDATFAINTIAPNGGMLNIIYKLKSGFPIEGIGTQFTIPIQYSDLNNQFSTDNQWEAFTTLNTSTNKYFIIQPKTSVGTGRLYNSLPTNNSTTEGLVTPNNASDLFFTSKIANGNISPLGNFNLSIGSYPTTPAGYIVKQSSMRVDAINNIAYNNTTSISGFWLKPLALSTVSNDLTTNSIDLMPGQSFKWRYSAFSNGSSFIGNNDGGAKGIYFPNSNTITFAKYCVDSDGDGIPDHIDLDDDNDGILDANESPNCFYEASEIKKQIVSVSSQFSTTKDFGLLYNDITETNAAQGFTFTTSQTTTTNPSGSNLFTIQFANPIELSSIIISDYISSSIEARAKLFGSNDGYVWVQLTSVDSNINTANGTTFTIDQNNSKYLYYKIQTTVAGNITTTNWIGEITPILANNYIPSAYPKNGTCTNDTDGDGIPNHIDLDSDNDNCLDAIEGAENVTLDMLVNAQIGLTVGVGSLATNQNLCADNSCVDSQGVPIIVNIGGEADNGSNTQGQDVGASQNFQINECELIISCKKEAIIDNTVKILPPSVIISSLNENSKTIQQNENYNDSYNSFFTLKKGLVLPRSIGDSAFPDGVLPEGLIYYDMTESCIKMYSNINGTLKWKCISAICND